MLCDVQAAVVDALLSPGEYLALSFDDVVHYQKSS
jgi:hypothetical protein